jgi:hypothetical protein
MNESKWIQENRAYTALNKLMAEASAVRSLFEAADIPIPPPLARMLGTMNGVSDGNNPHLHIAPPKPPLRPKGAKDDWIWIPVDALTETGLVLAVLASHVGAMTTKEILTAVKRLKPDAVVGTVYNVVARIKNELLEETDAGWKLRQPEKAPLLHDKYAWGHSEVFQKAELAAHRREVIVHLLTVSGGGLMNMQIVNQLLAPDMCRAPVTKDLVKIDLVILREQGRVRQIGNSRKYTV